MPDRAFSQVQLDALWKALAERASKGGVCPICGTNGWQAGDFVVNLQEQARTTGSLVVAGGRFYPTIPIICNTCGNTVLLNVHILGIAEALGVSPPTSADGDVAERSPLPPSPTASDETKRGG